MGRWCNFAILRELAHIVGASANRKKIRSSGVKESVLYISKEKKIFSNREIIFPYSTRARAWKRHVSIARMYVVLVRLNNKSNIIPAPHTIDIRDDSI